MEVRPPTKDDPQFKEDPHRPPAQVQLVRPQRHTEEELKIIKGIIESKGIWVTQKKDDDEETKLVRHLKFLLNKLTLDNFDSVYKEILENIRSRDYLEILINDIVTKAWKEPVYTNCYAQLISCLMKTVFEWQAPAAEKEAPSSKNNIVKELVLTKVETEYNEGFKHYYDYSKEIFENKELTADEKYEKLTKKRIVLLGNINLICELFSLKILSFYVMKWAILLGMSNYIKEYVANMNSKDEFSIKEDYLEALIKLFENSGQVIEKKEGDQKNALDEIDAEILNDMVEMINTKVDSTLQFLTRVEQKIKQISSITKIFFKFLRFLKNKEEAKISVRLESLIDNLFELHNSGWVVKVKRIEAAKKLADVRKEGEREPERDRDRERERERERERDYDNDNHFERQDTKGGKKNQQKKNPPQTLYVAKVIPKEKPIEEILDELKELHKASETMTSKEQYEKIFFGNNNKNYDALLKLFLENFATNIKKPSTMDVRYEVGLKFLVDRLVSEEKFYKQIAESYKTFSLIYCDETYLIEGLCEFFYQLRKANLINLAKLSICEKKGSESNDDDEEYNYFMSLLLAQMKKSLAQKPEADNYKAELAEIEKSFKN